MTPQVQSRACPSPGPHWGQPGYPHHRLGRRGKDWRNATWEKGPTSLHTLPRAAHALPGTLLSTLGPFRLKAHLPCEAERLRERHVVMSPPVGNRANEREVMPPGSWGGRGRTDPAWAGSQAPPDTSPGGAKDLPQFDPPAKLPAHTCIPTLGPLPAP